MKRIQTNIEKWQYTQLAQEAERQGVSITTLLRRLMLETIIDPVYGIIGLGVGPDDGITSENLDDYLYR